MSEGIRATVEFRAPSPCPIAAVSRESGAVVDDVWRSVPPTEAPAVTEFVLEADEPPSPDGADRVISLGGRHVFRFDHGSRETCPCECLGEVGCAVHRYDARPGSLRLVFNAADFEELQAAVGALRDRFPDLDVKRLLRSPDAEAAEDAVYVDRSRLTARQLEVLRTGYRMGYFERPRRANATEVADELDVDPSTLTEHLASAQRKLLGDVLEDEP